MKTDRVNAAYWVGGLAVLTVALFLFAPPIRQSESYHLFADGRTIQGIPNFWNVISNLPFAAVGLLGLWKLRGTLNRVLFAGVFLTCFGSTYYHWAPDDSRLVWDRLPMTLVFMSFLTSILTRNRSPRYTVGLLALLVACGAGSAVWWSMTNDLRPYVLVQFVPMLVVVPMLRRDPGRRMLSVVVGLYTVAKLAELCDRGVYSILPISGHTCKHLLAAGAAYYIYRWQLQARTGSAREGSMNLNGIVTLRTVSS
jgi:hypothetical protein